MASEVDAPSPRPALLETYIRAVLQKLETEDDVDPAYPIFTPSLRPPILHPGRINRVLVFSGCFNPPHKGHLQTLKHGFHNIGADLNVVAAFIKFSEVSSCAKKIQGLSQWRSSIGNTSIGNSSAEPFVLTRQQRISLWEGDAEASECLPWAWPCPFKRSELEDFLSLVQGAAKEDGMTLRFVRLCGGDHVSRVYTPPHALPEIAVTDVGRPVDFYHVVRGKQRLDDIPEFLPWNQLVVPKTQPASGGDRDEQGDKSIETQGINVFQCSRDPSAYHSSRRRRLERDDGDEAWPLFVRFIPADGE